LEPEFGAIPPTQVLLPPFLLLDLLPSMGVVGSGEGGDTDGWRTLEVVRTGLGAAFVALQVGEGCGLMKRVARKTMRSLC